MKRLLTAVILTPLATATFAVAQPNFNVSVDAYDIATNVYGIQLEWFKHKDFSILAKPYLLNRSESGIDWSGYGLELAGRMYEGGILGDSENPYGVFLQYGIDLGYVKIKLADFSDDSIFLGFNTKTGYRWIFEKHLTVDAGVGIGYYTSNVEYRADNYRDLDGVELFGIISAGYSF